MKISAKIDYACKAVMELSLHWPNETPVQINTIAAEQKIPLKFLTQILLTLKQLGMVKSTRGKNGGYVLSKSPSQISLNDVVGGFGGLDHLIADDKTCVINDIWKEVDATVAAKLATVTFDKIVTRHKETQNVMSYNI